MFANPGFNPVLQIICAATFPAALPALVDFEIWRYPFWCFPNLILSYQSNIPIEFAVSDFSTVAAGSCSPYGVVMWKAFVTLHPQLPTFS
jgi:hypothetical protein